MPEIHQVLPAFVSGDAIGNFAAQIQRGLLALGFDSRIYAESIEPAMLGRALRIIDLQFRAAPDAPIIYHHSIGTVLTDYVIHRLGPKLLVYHNITPGHLLRAHRPDFADLVDRGRRALPRLAPAFDLAVGVSEFNRRDLLDAGFPRTAVLPIPHDTLHADRTACRNPWPDPAASRAGENHRAPNDLGGMPKSADSPRRIRGAGMSNRGDDSAPMPSRLLFVGRMLPHKCPDRLLDWFARYLRFDPAARLALVGGLDERFPRFNDALIDRVRALGGAARLAGRVTEDELVNWYRWADVFLSFSVHEGFMVPLPEAMAGDAVIVARDIPAVRETLAGAGVLFRTPDDSLAALVHQICTDDSLRAALLTRQRARLRAFDPRTFLARLARLVDRWLLPAGVRA